VKKLITGALVVAAFTSGCAMQLNPSKRPMQQATVDQIKSPVSLVMQTPERTGVATTYFAQDSSAAGAQYGLIGALTTAVIDGIANSNPAEIATDNANRIAETIKGDELLSQAYSTLANTKAQLPPSVSLVFSAPTPAPAKSAKTAKVADGLSVDIVYSFKSDMSALAAYANVSLNVKGAEYKSPYIAKDGKPSKPDTTGLIYQNAFHYYSQQLSVPVKPQSDIDAKVAEITAKASKNGVPPKKGTPQYTKMNTDIKQAQKAAYTPKEIADKLADQWLANDGEKLKAEIKAAHEFIAAQIYKDLARFDVPDYKGTDTVLETTETGRVTKIVGAGFNAGSVHSEPKEFIAIGWGNAIVYPEVAKDKVKEKTKEKAKDK